MRKLNISIIIGVIIALVGASLVFFYGRHVDNKISDGKATMSVIVADSQQAISKTKLFASGVRVLSVSIADTKSDGTTGDGGSSPSGQVVALLDASPLVAQKIVNAVSIGTPYLAYAPTGGHTSS